jgi:membrane fusion protein, peptide pheromone/bacteriocin exporter
MTTHYPDLSQLHFFHQRKTNYVYLVCVLFVLSAVSSLPFIRYDVSVRASGIIRPASERTEIRSMIAGLIETVCFREGQNVPANAVIFRLKQTELLTKGVLNTFETNERKEALHDLEILTTASELNKSQLTGLRSPVYRQQLSRFLYQKDERETAFRKLKQERRIDSLLDLDGLIARKELFDKAVEYERLQAVDKVFKDEQLNLWQQDLLRLRLELSQLEYQKNDLTDNAELYDIRSPVAGVVQGLGARYPGGIVQAGETLCTVSPETELIAECYVPTRDVGLLKPGQAATFQIDAFDYKHFGVLGGRITAIDNDFTLVDNKAVFKIKCSFDDARLVLKNGFSGRLKKGLTFQARFMITQRSVWQMLFDTVDDWLNPTAPDKKQNLF